MRESQCRVAFPSGLGEVPRSDGFSGSCSNRYPALQRRRSLSRWNPQPLSWAGEVSVGTVLAGADYPNVLSSSSRQWWSRKYGNRDCLVGCGEAHPALEPHVGLTAIGGDQGCGGNQRDDPVLDSVNNGSALISEAAQVGKRRRSFARRRNGGR